MSEAHRHLLTLFAELLEADTTEAQSAYLDRVCHGAADLRSRLEALLRAHRDAGAFLGGHTSPFDPILAVDPPVCSEGPGAVFGPYKLLQQIGEGGMGTVYMAEQTEPVRRLVALKIIKPGMDSRRVIARFEAERQALALMDHPNIAKVFDAGTTATGRPYFVMELVKGVPITKYCDERHLTPKRRLELFLPVCQAVQHAHQKGIIHRDLKPSNVLIAEYDDKAVAKVIDFGIAKATGGKLTDRTMFTELGQVVGTLEYMSPEQAKLNALDIDTRSDIYSLGVLLYELLTGTTPFEKKRFQKAAFDEILRVIREEEPQKPSTRLSTTDELPSLAANRGLEPKKLSGLMRGDLDWITMKCLEKDRNRRYETANGLALDVQRYLADEPVLASPPSALYRLRKFARRHKAGLLTTAVATLVLVLATGGIAWVLWDRMAQETARRADRVRHVAETERTVTPALVKAEQSVLRVGSRQQSATSEEAQVALTDWREAAAALAEAEAALATGAMTDDLRERVAAMRQRIDSGKTREQRREKLFHDLDEARLASAVVVENSFDNAAAAAKFEAAFAAYGLDVKPGHTEELARQIRAEDAAVRDVLLVALSTWTFAAAKAKATPSAGELAALAVAADDDPWRQRLWQATAARDKVALRDLSIEARSLPLSPSTLVLLAVHLVDANNRADSSSRNRPTGARGRRVKAKD